VDDLFSLTSGSFISSEVLPEAVGSAGEVSVVAGSLILDTDSYISSDTHGQGDAGHVSVQANGLISLAGGSYISSDTLGQGNAGHVSLQADGLISLASSSSISSDVWSKAVGNAGEVSVVAGRLTLDTDSYISSETLGQGNAGHVSLQADDLISLANSSFISSDVWSKAVGNAGEVFVVAGRLTLDTDSYISSETRGLGDAGNIWVQADDSIFLTAGSFISSDTHGKGNSGTVLVQADNALSLAGNSYISSLVSSEAIGSGGNITITVGLLSVTQGAELNTSTLGQGDAGDIVIRANSIVSFDGVGSTVFSGVGGDWSQGFVGIGNGGDIDIQAKFLSVTGGAELVAQTLGEGNAGNININTSEAVSISGAAPFPMLGDGRPGGFSSGLITSTEQGARGQGGNINVTTPNLRISDGAVLNARSRSEFSGGNITINTNSLEVTGGGQILSTAFSNGDAGNITVNVTDQTTISGSDPTFIDRFNQVAQVFGEPQARFTLDPVGAESGLFANTVPGSTGKGGDIFINSNQVAISNGAKVAVDSQGQGNGGNITIQANSLTLNDKASIVAQTASGEGGNLTLQVNDILIMRHNSLISAEAGGTGNGGNIDIDADFVVAVPKEDSDIVANAYQGRGGNINITTQGIYGLEFRPNRTPLSDITASSQFGVNGVVQINTLGVDPSRGLAKLPTDVVHAEGLIDRHCTPGRDTNQRSSFTVTGRGGLPPSPNDPLRGETVITNWVTLDSEDENRDRTASPPNSTTTTTNQLVEAQGWIIGSDGQVILTAQAPTVTPQTTELTSPSCQDFQTDTP
ncbi:MAG TPA: S-layer family protein, partial [Allocoleopsis sp.]